jgi:predicted RNase H-like HicB family nuclease
MRFEVEVIREESGLYRATAVTYPGVTASGRTEKEALGLLVEAMGRRLRQEARKAREARDGG